MSTRGDENERIRQLVEIDRGTLPPDGGDIYNRLIFATSPYLLQHAENPVDWYEWGEEAFSVARRENKPIFLSIGYATCHWCHVMAHESFEDREVAEVLNANFVTVKVDREERPDIDAQYMTVAQMMTGSGGWPLTIVMTPEGEPFFAATYLPNRPRMGMPGIITILNRITQFWRFEPEKVADNCAAIMNSLKRYHDRPSATATDKNAEGTAARQLTEMYDREWGGFGDAPKFPMPLNYAFLLRYAKKTGNRTFLEMADHSLRKMRQGGIFDQLGFGFHRYSVDREWLVPHFEKMLYDQALLSHCYLEAYQASGEVSYRQVADEVFDFVLRELTSPDGAFYAALDADSEGEEGKFYVWTPAEVEQVLGREEGGLFCRLFGIREEGNFEGKSIPHLPLPLARFAEREGMPETELRRKVETWRQALLVVREERVRPFLDQKAVAAWNGMMMASLAKGYGISGEVRYLLAAERCAQFLLGRQVDREGRLMRSFHLGRASVPGFLEDYAAVIWGLAGLYEATLNSAYLTSAERLSGEMVRLFRGQGGMFHDSGSDTAEILIRMSTTHDGVVPSGNSLAALSLAKMGRMLRQPQLVSTAREIIAAVVAKESAQPVAHLGIFLAAACTDESAIECTFAGTTDSAAAREMVTTLHQNLIPGLVVRHAAGNDPEYPVQAGRTAAYVCVHGACRPPVRNAAELQQLLAGIA